MPAKPLTALTAWVHNADLSPDELLLSHTIADDLNVSAGAFVQLRLSAAAEARADAIADLQHHAANAKPNSQQLMPSAAAAAAAATPGSSSGTSSASRAHGPIVLRVGLAPKEAKASLQVSILKAVAELYGLPSRLTVELLKLTLSEASLDWVEMVFKDQYISRGDLWYWQHTMMLMQPTVFVGKTFLHSSARLQVVGMTRNGKKVSSGALSHETRVIFRSRSANLFLLIQMSPEMWEAGPDGKLAYEKALTFLSTLFAHWDRLQVTHHVTVVFFGRCFTDEKPRATSLTSACGGEPLEPSAAAATASEGAWGAPTGGGGGGAGGGGGRDSVRDRGLMRDRAGRAHTDYYKLVVESESRQEWASLLPTIRAEIHGWRASLKRREYAVDGRTSVGAVDPSRGGDKPTSGADQAKEYLRRHPPPIVFPGRLCGAQEGNLLEAINLALDILESSNEELDLAASGKSVVVVTAASGCFEVDYALSQLTKQRMVDNGIGCDMVCARSPPLHLVPLFTYVSHNASARSARSAVGVEVGSVPHSAERVSALRAASSGGEVKPVDKWYRIPQWILISFTDPAPPPSQPACCVTAAPPQSDDSAIPLHAQRAPPLPPLSLMPLPPSGSKSTDGADIVIADADEGMEVEPGAPTVGAGLSISMSGGDTAHPSIAECIASVASSYDKALFSPTLHGRAPNGHQDEETVTPLEAHARKFAEAASEVTLGQSPRSQAASLPSPSQSARSPPQQSAPIPATGSVDGHATLPPSTSNGSLYGAFPALPGWLHGAGAGAPRSFEANLESLPRPDGSCHPSLLGTSSHSSSSASSLTNPLSLSTESLPACGSSPLAPHDGSSSSILIHSGQRAHPTHHHHHNHHHHHHHHHQHHQRPPTMTPALVPEEHVLGDDETDLVDGVFERSTQGALETAQLLTRLESVGAAKSAAPRGSISRTNRKSVNPFSYRLPSEASTLQQASESSYAHRRWASVRSSASRDGAIGANGEEFGASADNDRRGKGTPDDAEWKRQQPAALAEAEQWGKVADNEAANTEKYHQYEAHFEHQWRSLTEPAVLPLTAEGTAEQLQMMRRNLAAESWWELTLPRQEEVKGLLPYEKVMSAEELLYELVGQRLELDFQLLRSPEKRSPVSLLEEQTFYLALGAQVQAIKFVKDEQQPHIPPRAPRFARSTGSAIFGRGLEPTAANSTTPEGGWSRIHITRHFVQSHHEGSRKRLGYHYMIAGPFSNGFERAYTHIRPVAPHEFPWNSLDQTVCGWNAHLSPAMRLRSKRFALLNFEKRHEDSLSTLLSAPLGTQRLIGAALLKERSGLRGGVDETQDGGRAEAPIVPPEGETTAAGNVTLSRERFELFISSICPRLPEEMNESSVVWRDFDEMGGTSEGSNGVASKRELGPKRLLDREAVKDVTMPSDDSGSFGRRMFFRLLYDSEACETQAWHLELQWVMCEGPQIEDFVKHCTRKARQAGLLMLQLPTNRRPRPFTPHAVVPVSPEHRQQAAAALCKHVGFVRECAIPHSERWMHEFGVAFVKSHPRGFRWEVNPLLPSHAAREHSAKLLAQFRDYCESLEFTLPSATASATTDVLAYCT